MSMVHYQEITLRDVAGQARYVLLVKKTEPFVEYEDVLISEDSVNYPPFKKTKYNFIVSRRLDKLEGGPEIGERIVAIDAKYPGQLEAHKLFYLQNQNKSPIFEQYESQADFEKENELILFISIAANNEYLFSAFESAFKIEEVKKILESLPSDTTLWAEEVEMKDLDVHKPQKPK
jgi:hypothetical protein